MPKERKDPRPWDGLRAADLADMLAREVFDAEDAGRFLGIARNSIEYAAYRKRIPFVQYGAKKLFTRADLEDYAKNRGRGRESRLADAKPFVIEKATDDAAK